MSNPSRRSFCFLILALLAAAAGPAFAADSPPPAVAADPSAQAPPAIAPFDAGVEGALEQSWDQQYGDCKLWCNAGQQYWYGRVTREQCCGGTLTCPDGSSPSGYAFYPYQGFAEFCSY